VGQIKNDLDEQFTSRVVSIFGYHYIVIIKLFITTTMTTKIKSHKYKLKSCKTNLKETKAYNAEIRSYKQ